MTPSECARLQAQLTAALIKIVDLTRELQSERLARLAAERKLVENAQGGVRYARNVPRC